MMSLTSIAFAAVLLATGAGDRPHPETARREPIRVVTSLPIYADLVQLLGGAEVTVTSIAEPGEDAHFVRPKPSFALAIRRADMFVTTGLDLELWVPTLLDRAGNAAVNQGGRGYVTAYTGIELLDIPATADRSGGDVHIYGNPHLATDPLRAIQVAANITTGLKRVAPDRADVFDAGLTRFREDVHRRLFGAELVEMIGGETLEDLARSGTLHQFLADNELEGQPLTGRLGGWLAAAEPFRGKRLICYHKNWAYFEDRFDVTCADFVEAKPGISPTPRHVSQLIDLMQRDNIRVLIAATHFDQTKVEAVARRGGATPVVIPLEPRAVPRAGDYFSLVDTWVELIADAMVQSGS